MKIHSKFIDVILNSDKGSKIELFGAQQPTLDGDKRTIPIFVRIKDCPKGTFVHYKIE
jgi:hypothetical protein